MRVTCPECGEPCRVVVRDFGVGETEFWGHRQTDVQMVAVSDCCEALMEENAMTEASYDKLANGWVGGKGASK